jgi:hypothetical protein
MEMIPCVLCCDKERYIAMGVKRFDISARIILCREETDRVDARLAAISVNEARAPTVRPAHACDDGQVWLSYAAQLEAHALTGLACVRIKDVGGQRAATGSHPWRRVREAASEHTGATSCGLKQNLCWRWLRELRASSDEREWGPKNARSKNNKPPVRRDEVSTLVDKTMDDKREKAKVVKAREG